MTGNKNLFCVVCIPFVLSIFLAVAALGGASSSFGYGCLYLVLLPLGVVCPLLGAGCLLHDRMEDRFPRAARALRRAGYLFVAALAAALCWMRLA